MKARKTISLIVCLAMLAAIAIMPAAAAPTVDMEALPTAAPGEIMDMLTGDPAAQAALEAIMADQEAAPQAAGEEAQAAPAALSAIQGKFADAADVKNTEAVMALVSLGIIDGIAQPDGSLNFAPGQSITREQMAKIVAIAYSMYSGKEIGSGTATFADVSGRWSESFVAFCADNGIISGRSSTVFDYAGSITVTETAKLILAAAGVTGLTGDGWKTVTLTAANAIGLLEGVESGSDEAITRDEAALVLYRAVSYLQEALKPKPADEAVAAAMTMSNAGNPITDIKVSSLEKMVTFRARSDKGAIYLGAYIKDGALVESDSNILFSDPTSLVYDFTAAGPGVTALYAAGEATDVKLTGTINLTDEGDGTYASDFTGLGTAIVAGDKAKVTVDAATITTDGFLRDAFIVDDGADMVVTASTVTTLGANPLTEAYEGYINSANQSIMLSPPWVLGIQGGVRSANVMGDHASLSVIDSIVTSGSWAVLSTDDCTEPVVNILDSSLIILTEEEGGMSSGDFDYSSKYGTGYGTYSIGYAEENFLGATVSGATYGTILRSGTINYKSSNGTIELKNAQGSVIYTGQGKGNPTTINTVFGVMTHSGEDAILNASEGTVFNTEEAAILYKDSKTATFSLDNCVVNSGSGIILQMIDDDDSIVGADMSSGSPAFRTVFNEEAGWPSENGSVSGKAGGSTVYLNLTNGQYTGDALNGTGYYGQGGDALVVTIGQGASLNGKISLTETQHKVKSFTINEYYYLGQVENRNYNNGYSTTEVTVQAGSTWTVTEDSLLNKLTIEAGATVNAALTENADGTITLTPAETALEAGVYGE